MIPVWNNPFSCIISSFRKVEQLFSVSRMALFGNQLMGVLSHQLVMSTKVQEHQERP
jgi:hypothetical protein